MPSVWSLAPANGWFPVPPPLSAVGRATVVPADAPVVVNRSMKTDTAVSAAPRFCVPSPARTTASAGIVVDVVVVPARVVVVVVVAPGTVDVVVVVAATVLLVVLVATVVVVIVVGGGAVDVVLVDAGSVDEVLVDAGSVDVLLVVVVDACPVTAPNACDANPSTSPSTVSMSPCVAQPRFDFSRRANAPAN